MSERKSHLLAKCPGDQDEIDRLVYERNEATERVKQLELLNTAYVSALSEANATIQYAIDNFRGDGFDGAITEVPRQAEQVSPQGERGEPVRKFHDKAPSRAEGGASALPSEASSKGVLVTGLLIESSQGQPVEISLDVNGTWRKVFTSHISGLFSHCVWLQGLLQGKEVPAPTQTDTRETLQMRKMPDLTKEQRLALANDPLIKGIGLDLFDEDGYLLESYLDDLLVAVQRHVLSPAPAATKGPHHLVHKDYLKQLHDDLDAAKKRADLAWDERETRMTGLIALESAVEAFLHGGRKQSIQLNGTYFYEYSEDRVKNLTRALNGTAPTTARPGGNKDE